MNKRNTTMEWLTVGIMLLLLMGVSVAVGIAFGQQMATSIPAQTAEPVVLVVTATSEPVTPTSEPTTTAMPEPADATGVAIHRIACGNATRCSCRAKPDG
ncbi:MAG: hypothetical protein HC837_14845 [Chloroflexaceae bacterium]|nr:hypothetical protein [Chloroflexaceae bacterium]